MTATKRPTYRCKCHGFVQKGNGWVMQMTIEDRHVATGFPAGTYGHTSQIKSVDFEKGIVETKNSTYLIGEA